MRKWWIYQKLRTFCLPSQATIQHQNSASQHPQQLASTIQYRGKLYCKEGDQLHQQQGTLPRPLGQHTQYRQSNIGQPVFSDAAHNCSIGDDQLDDDGLLIDLTHISEPQEPKVSSSADVNAFFRAIREERCPDSRARVRDCLACKYVNSYSG